MGGNKRGSRSGSYVGNFLQLFDWNAKSRKRLFSSKSDLAEQLRQGKTTRRNLPVTSIHLEEEEELGVGFGIKGSSSYSCGSSSITDDDIYGMKAPGVVARLMGLDSLPSSSSMEPYATTFSETQSLGETSFRRKDLDLYPDPQMMHSKRHLVDKVESPPRKAFDFRPQKMTSRPIEKFQSEILPPKSAKTIPITHHKLLSPIKTPVFVPTQDAGHIMEAAARIIEPGPWEIYRKRMSSVRKSSVPFKVPEMKEKMETVRRSSKVTEQSGRPVESKMAKHLRGQSMNKICNVGSNDSSFRVSPSRDDSSGSLYNKGKSVSLAIQAKVNVQKRGGSSPSRSSSRSLRVSGEQDETKPFHSFKASNRKLSTQSSSSVLRQNNVKQNSSTYRDRLASKTSTAASNGRKKVSIGESRNYRTASRKSRLQASGDQDFPYSGLRNAPRKKRSIDSSAFGSDQSINDMISGKLQKPANCDSVSDVVSFTFSSPIAGSFPGSDSSKRLGENNGYLFLDDRGKKLPASDCAMLSLPGLNGIGSDCLSSLLEKKLKELTSSFETSEHSLNGAGKNYVKKAKTEQRVNQINSEIYSSLSLNKPEQFRPLHNFQALKAIDEYDSFKAEVKQWNDCHIPSPVSILEPSILTESCTSSESMASSSTEESNKLCSSIQAQKVHGSSSSNKHHIMETDIDTSDSATSSTLSQISSSKDSTKITTWELIYIQDIICSIELMFNNYSNGLTQNLVNPNLFDQLERQQRGFKIGGTLRLERKLLFDCVSESLDLKCQCFIGGGFELWERGIVTMKRKERLAEEVHKEIKGWRSLRKSMVDELVDKDMSTKYGGWVDFEVDEFEVEVEIQCQILESLVLEIVADL